jgi:hypothetical protein
MFLAADFCGKYVRLSVHFNTLPVALEGGGVGGVTRVVDRVKGGGPALPTRRKLGQKYRHD